MEFKKEKIIGVYRLVSYHVTDADGNITYPMGKDCTGFIMYHPDGYMSAQMMSQGRPVYESKSLHTGTLEEMATAAEGYMAYSGPYEVDEQNKVVTHHMTVSMNPTWLGDSQQRYVNLKEGNLEITSQPIIVDGKEQTASLVSKRIESIGVVDGI